MNQDLMLLSVNFGFVSIFDTLDGNTVLFIALGNSLFSVVIVLGDTQLGQNNI